MEFSSRTGWDLAEHPLATQLRKARERGAEIVDLTRSSPGSCGLAPAPEQTVSALQDPALLGYDPDPLGALPARQAVASYYGSHAAQVPPQTICLTASTSEAYSFLFRLLCDAGDKVLVARPSYPLFEFIARLDNVRLAEYPLLYEPGGEGGWRIDLPSLEAAITPRTRAIVVVHPNNPTGNFASAAEREALDRIAAAHGIALIVDEVFLDFALGPNPKPTDGESLDPANAVSFAAEPRNALTFVLSGLSKVCGLPQMKLSWIAAVGPPDLTHQAMQRLEVIADTFLSVGSLPQLAVGRWLRERGSFQHSIRTRLRDNYQALKEALTGSHASPLILAGGWTAMLRVPRFAAGKPFAEEALRRSVLVQPGESYGASAGHVVLSLLTPPEDLQRGLRRLPLDLPLG